MCTELIDYYEVEAEILCICLHTISDDHNQARFLKQKLVISEEPPANALYLHH